jgi:heme exporter protein B
MWPKAFVLAAKDIRLIALSGYGLAQALLLGLLLIFLFSLAQPANVPVAPQWAAAIFWLASCFSLVLIFNTLYALEEENEARLALLLAPLATQTIWLGKALGGAFLLLCVQAVFVPAVIVFLGLEVLSSWIVALGLLIVIDWGLVTLGSLLGALGQGQAGRDSLLTVVIFPLLIPLLLAGIRVGGSLLQIDQSAELASWFKLAGSFDALYTGAVLILFPFVYSNE